MDQEMTEIAARAAAVRPSPQQLAWQEMEITTFIHFGMATFHDEEDWGRGTEDPGFFNPSGLDPDQWVATCKIMGSGMLILTAKHHDGFCLWPTNTTDHNIAHSRFRDGKADIVGEVAEACRRGGIKFGIYLSPWDRHEPCYGTPAYNEFFLAQLRELCTNYGEIAELWFDGACGEGSWGKVQQYDWPACNKLIRELQPNALIANEGPGLRWGGNESGIARHDEWSVYGLNIPPDEFRNWDAVSQAGNFPWQTDGLSSLGVKPIADLATLATRKHLFWYPAEVDFSLRMVWFWHPNQEGMVSTTEQLLDTYYKSVGRNGGLLLGLAPNREGRIPEFDVARLTEWRNALNATFDNDLAKAAAVTATNTAAGSDPQAIVDGKNDTYWQAAGNEPATIELRFDAPVTFNRIMLQEMISQGQQVDNIPNQNQDGRWQFQVLLDDRWLTMAKASAIGHKRLVKIGTLTTSAVRLELAESRGAPTIRRIGLFNAAIGG